MRKVIAAVTVLACLIPMLARAQNANQTLSTTTFVVVGDGLAAGMANMGLSADYQDKSFPAQMARQIKTAFPQPLLEAPGLGDPIGYQKLPVRVPTYPQGRVRIYPHVAGRAFYDETPTLFVFNLSVPNYTVADTVSRKPQLPLVQRDMEQTTANFILGFPALVLNKSNIPLWTQLEYAQAMMPTLALVQLGYEEVFQAAVTVDPSKLPDPGAFQSNFKTIVTGLANTHATVIVANIPDPIDTAYFMTPATAARILQTTQDTLTSKFGLQPGDMITRNGLVEIGFQLTTYEFSPLPADSIARASVVNQISARVNALNGVIQGAAQSSHAEVYDLNALFHRIHTSPSTINGVLMTGDYFGGFYTIDAIHPGWTGHALIANDLLTFINGKFSTSFPLLDVAAIAAIDPVMGYLPPSGSRTRGRTGIPERQPRTVLQ